MSLIVLNAELVALKKRLEALETNYQRGKKEIEKDIKAVQQDITFITAELDIGKIRLAETVFEFEGDPRKYPEAAKAIADAKAEIAASDKPLQKRYIGLKDYAHWIGQREDHKYGYGPSHGSIVFRIGVRRGVIGEPLSKGVREAALYYLDAWPQIIDARRVA